MRGRHADRGQRRWGGRATGALVTLGVVTLGAGALGAGMGPSNAPSGSAAPPAAPGAAAPWEAPDENPPPSQATPDQKPADDDRVAGGRETEPAPPGPDPVAGGGGPARDSSGDGGAAPPDDPAQNPADDAADRAQRVPSVTGPVPPADAPPGQPENADAPGSCSAAYRETSRFVGGFTGEVTIRAEGAPITSWQATLTFGDPPPTVDVRDGNAVRDDAGGALTVTPRREQILSPGGTTAFRFTARGTGDLPPPALACQVIPAG